MTILFRNNLFTFMFYKVIDTFTGTWIPKIGFLKLLKQVKVHF